MNCNYLKKYVEKCLVAQKVLLPMFLKFAHKTF